VLVTGRARRHVRLRGGRFRYNQQVTGSLTGSFISLAQASGVPVAGVYETMPVPGYDYQSWMLAEVRALDKAVTAKVSTGHL